MIAANRVGAVVETDSGTRLLIDTPPELRLQLIACGVDRDRCRFVHARPRRSHARPRRRSRVHDASRCAAADVRVSGHARSYLEALSVHLRRAGQAVAWHVEAGRQLRVMAPGETTEIGDIAVSAIEVPHGAATVFAYRIGALAYVTDAKRIPPEAMEKLRGAQGAGDQRAAADRTSDAPVDSRGDQGCPAGWRGSHLSHAPDARELSRGPRGRTAAGDFARVRRADGEVD